MFQGGGFRVSPYLRQILAARNAGADKKYVAEQAKATVDADTAREMGRAAEELMQVQPAPRKLPGADNPFWAKPREYSVQPEQPRFYEVPHTMGAVGPVKEYQEPKRDYAQQLAYDMKGAAADPNVQERAEQDAKLGGLAALLGRSAATGGELPEDETKLPRFARGIR